jgi:hypothetical protein
VDTLRFHTWGEGPIQLQEGQSEDKTRQDKTRQDKTRQGKARQDKTSQDKTRQDKTSQDKTRQDKVTSTPRCVEEKVLPRNPFAITNGFIESLPQR